MSFSFKKNTFIKTVGLFIFLLILVIPVYAFFNPIKIPQPKTLALVSETTKDVPHEEELLGKAELSYAGGTPGRNQNIEIGVSRLDGIVIPPGKEFSFTKAIGSVTPEDGFSEEKVFLNGEVTKGLGGGLCQVSTTLFRTALKAGLPITERHNHTYTVSRYDVGLDATYSDPGPDLKFVNDTAYPITIKGKTEDEKVVFELYGVYDGRIATTTEPEITKIVDVPPTKYIGTRSADEVECINTPQIGYTATVHYSVFYPQALMKEQVFTSTYKPLQRICYVLMN